MAGRTLRFAELETGCFVPLSHGLNQDGYFRKRWGNSRREDFQEMFHRTIWRLHKGDIPMEYEIDHMCGNRACCNVKHLRCIHGIAHTIYTNQTRWLDR